MSELLTVFSIALGLATGIGFNVWLYHRLFKNRKSETITGNGENQ